MRVVFRGLRDLNVIHEALEDGAEIAFEAKVGVPPKKLATWIRSKKELAVFSWHVSRRGDAPQCDAGIGDEVA